jgi:hypothetical protein
VPHDVPDTQVPHDFDASDASTEEETRILWGQGPWIDRDNHHRPADHVQDWPVDDPQDGMQPTPADLFDSDDISTSDEEQKEDSSQTSDAELMDDDDDENNNKEKTNKDDKRQGCCEHKEKELG